MAERGVVEDEGRKSQVVAKVVAVMVVVVYMEREVLWNVGVLVVVFRKQVGSYRSLKQGQEPEGGRGREEEQMKKKTTQEYGQE